MKKLFSGRVNKLLSVAFLLIAFSASVLFFPGQVFSASILGTNIGNDIGFKSSDMATGTAQEQAYDELQNAGCDPDVWAELMKQYNNAIQENNKMLELHEWNGKGENPTVPKSVKKLSCFQDDLKELWNNSKKIMDSVESAKNFFSSFDPKDLFSAAETKIKDEISKLDIGELACQAGDYLKKFILAQEQCFDFSKLFQWRRGSGFEFDKCLIRAKIHLNQNGFQYNVSSTYFQGANSQGRFGLDDLGILGEDGVSTLFDNSWSGAAGSVVGSSSLRCGPLDPQYAAYKANTGTANTTKGDEISLFDPAPQLKLEEYANGSTQWVWTPAAGCTDSSGNSCETRASCYPIDLTLAAPGGACFKLDSDGLVYPGARGIPPVLASINTSVCQGVSVPGGNSGCSVSYDGNIANYSSYNSVINTCSVASASHSNVTCLSNKAYQDVCGMGSNVSCCDPAVQDCSQSIIPICFCTYPTQSPANADLDYTKWQTIEIGGGADDGNPANNILANGYNCSNIGLVNNCCDPEINDCENLDVLKAMDQCVDESLLCVDFGTASMIDSEGNLTDVDLTKEITMAELFSVFDYLVIKPDASLPAYLEENQTKRAAKDIQCCATEWCNICPDMVRGAMLLRDDIGLSPNQIGVASNSFMNGTSAVVASAQLSKVGVDYGSTRPVFFGGAATGNVYAKRDRPGLALQANVTQPPAARCKDVQEVPAEIIACGHVTSMSGFYKRYGTSRFSCSTLGKILSFGTAKCEKGDDQCKSVPPLAPELIPYEEKLLSEGMPIANISNAADFEGENPRICSEYAQCNSKEFLFNGGGDFWTGGCMSAEYTTDEKELCCAVRCDQFGLSSTECYDCATQVFGCTTGFTASQKSSREACAGNAVRNTVASSPTVTAQMCSQSLCEGTDLQISCAACGSRYGCSSCNTTSNRASCQTCLNGVQEPSAGTTTTTTGGGTTTTDTDTDTPTRRPRPELQTLTPELQTPAVEQPTSAPAWQERPSVAPQQAPASSGGVMDTLKSLF